MLLLFDIDGTLLLHAHEAHRDALHAALHEVYGIADPAAAPVHAPGRTDGELARAIAVQAGVSAERIDEGADAVRDATCREFARRCPSDLRERVAPGMADVLAGLAGRGGVRLSLLTGNYEPIARLKLERAGLAHFFPAGQGAFGSDEDDRAALPRIARWRAGADGVRCLAIATGPFRPADLEAAGADAVAADARGLGALVGALL